MKRKLFPRSLPLPLRLFPHVSLLWRYFRIFSQFYFLSVPFLIHSFQRFLPSHTSFLFDENSFKGNKTGAHSEWFWGHTLSPFAKGSEEEKMPKPP